MIPSPRPRLSGGWKYIPISHIVKLATKWKLCRVSTYLPDLEALWNTFGTPTWPPQSLSRDQGLWVARNTFLWVILNHRNFTEDLGMLGKSLQTVWRSCWWLRLHPSPSQIFHRIMYKYKAKPPLNNILTHSILFITPIFELDSFALSQTKNSSQIGLLSLE